MQFHELNGELERFGDLFVIQDFFLFLGDEHKCPYYLF